MKKLTVSLFLSALICLPNLAVCKNVFSLQLSEDGKNEQNLKEIWRFKSVDTERNDLLEMPIVTAVSYSEQQITLWFIGFQNQSKAQNLSNAYFVLFQPNRLKRVLDKFPDLKDISVIIRAEKENRDKFGNHLSTEFKEMGRLCLAGNVLRKLNLDYIWQTFYDNSYPASLQNALFDTLVKLRPGESEKFYAFMKRLNMEKKKR